MKQGSILIVEDNQDTQRVLQLLLAKAGYVVTAVANGRRALRLVHDLKFDLILVDLLMPEMPGLRLIRYLKHRPQFADIPIIAMTAFGSQYGVDYLSLAIEAGARAGLRKPEEIDRLVDIVSATVGA